MAKLLSWALYVRFAGMFAQLQSLAQWSGGAPKQTYFSMSVQQRLKHFNNQRTGHFKTVLGLVEYLSHAILTMFLAKEWQNYFLGLYM